MTGPCRRCGSPVPATVRYCESCGADLDSPKVEAEPPAAEWELVIQSDRDYFERVEAECVEFPSADINRTYPLTADRITVGRRSSQSTEPVDLDLSGPPADAGISHVHASFVRQPDGAWAVVDCRSTNGTFLNDQEVPIPPGEPVELGDGDRIHLGAWTCITVRRMPHSA